MAEKTAYLSFQPLAGRRVRWLSRIMSAPEGIDWSWAVATGGALSSHQRRQLLTPLVRTVVAYSTCRARLALGRRGTGGVDVDQLRWPDSALARAAEEEARECLSPDLLAHSYRSYLFGLSLAALDGARVDEELCYVACLLHDLHLGASTPGRCFAVVGGERAERFALDRGEPPPRAAAIGAAIAAHITVGASEDLSDPGGFVSAGAFVDVSGTRIDELAPGWVHELLTRHPRHDFKRHLLKYWSDESAAVPAGRARWLTRVAGFPLLVRLAPFPE
jgi:hypothetical protein